MTSVNPAAFAMAAISLALERLTYALVWQRPDLFVRFCQRFASDRSPVDVLAALFAGFKMLQVAVFVAWCAVHGDFPSRASDRLDTLLAGAVFLGAGQILNAAVFWRLGRRGVFYGNRFGVDTPWCASFPFPWIRHPQYVGTVLSIWAFFLVMRYPAPDWAVLPLLETVYYMLGAAAEQSPVADVPATHRLSHATAVDPHAAERLP